ncbi:uncharacterized protein LOC128502831 isoform X2 [Spea bombifrons]|uniref:uncharacterized protein LOC128502831 isoform X2 n=1 Tax=Spea bombifrons TaxID=233779 RepID=UPI00234B66B9|nr:uncharacterized protein LOC128502831 isoform X2 [Spea bombifrons]
MIREKRRMVSQTLLLALSLSVLLTQLVLSRLSDSLLTLSDSAHTLYLVIGLCPHFILSRSSSLPQYARVRLPTLFSLLAPLFLSSLGLSLTLGSLGRIVRPHSLHRPVLILVAGALGLVFKVVYMGITGTWKGLRVAGVQPRQSRWPPILLVLASFTPSVLLLASGLFLHLFSHPSLHYMDPALCLASITVMVASVYSTIVQNAYLLLQAVPPCADVLTLKHDLDTLCGPKGHHELHVWALAPGHAVATLHISCTGPEAYKDFLNQARPIFGRHGVDDVTIQPEFGSPGRCCMACGPACAKHLCCISWEPETKGLILENACK